MARVLTARTCGPGGDLLNASDACPGAARPVDSPPRCAHICPQITPRLSIPCPFTASVEMSDPVGLLLYCILSLNASSATED